MRTMLVVLMAATLLVTVFAPAASAASPDPPKVDPMRSRDVGHNNLYYVRVDDPDWYRFDYAWHLSASCAPARNFGKVGPVAQWDHNVVPCHTNYNEGTVVLRVEVLTPHWKVSCWYYNGTTAGVGPECNPQARTDGCGASDWTPKDGTLVADGTGGLHDVELIGGIVGDDADASNATGNGTSNGTAPKTTEKKGLKGFDAPLGEDPPVLKTEPIPQDPAPAGKPEEQGCPVEQGLPLPPLPKSAPKTWTPIHQTFTDLNASANWTLRSFLDLNNNSRLDPGEPLGRVPDLKADGRAVQPVLTHVYGGSGDAQCLGRNRLEAVVSPPPGATGKVNLRVELRPEGGLVCPTLSAGAKLDTARADALPFAFEGLNASAYTLVAYDDRNNNGQLDAGEPSSTRGGVRPSAAPQPLAMAMQAPPTPTPAPTPTPTTPPNTTAPPATPARTPTVPLAWVLVAFGALALARRPRR